MSSNRHYVGGELYLDCPPDGDESNESAHTARLAVRLAPVTRREEDENEDVDA